MSSKAIWQVSDRFCPIVLDTHDLVAGVSVGTMKAEMPRLPASGSVTANTITVWPLRPDVMNCLAPLIT